MEREFNPDRLYANISKLMKDQGIKVSEIESVMGVSTGYFSKLSKNQTVPNADVLFRIAQRLGVTVDMLITCDLTNDRATNNLRLMTAYIQKLRKQTDTTDIRWTKKTDADMELDFFLSGDDEPTMLMSMKKFGAEKENLLFYANLMSRNRIDFAGESYMTTMDGYVLFMNKLSETITEGDRTGESIVYYELDSWVPNEAEFICSSKATPEVQADLELLYVCLQKHAADLQLTESVRSKIFSFVNPPKPTMGQMLASLSREFNPDTPTGGN